MINDEKDVVQNLSAVGWNKPVMNYNLDYLQFGSPFFVRESGIFVVFFEINTAEAAQFSVEVNAIIQPYAIISSNSGAGQILVRAFLKLKENDNVVVRNNFSGVSINSDINDGGTNTGNSSTITIFKIAPYCAPEPEYKRAKKDGHKHKKLFEKLECQFEEDCELMIKGFNVTGSFFNRSAQLIPLEGDIVFNELTEDRCMTWDPLAPTQVKIKENGVYNVYFQVNTQTAGQLAVTVNGVPDENTTEGINKGAGQISGRSLLTLKKGDVLTLRNHSSDVGDLQITSFAGGLSNCVAAMLMLFKQAPIVKPCIKKVPHWLAEKLECVYPKLKNWLVCDRDLAVAGSSAYINLCSSTEQMVAQNAPFYLSTNALERDVDFKQGSYSVEIEQSGVYDIFATVATNQPLQLTVFVNGVGVSTTNFGRDSGASRCYVRQFIALKCGDVVSVNNFLSASSDVHTVSSGLGQYLSNSVGFALFKMHANCEPRPCPPPCKCKGNGRK